MILMFDHQMLLVIILVFTLFTSCLTILITDAACDHPRVHLVHLVFNNFYHQMLLVIILVFTLCWFPRFLLNIIK